MNKKVVNKLLDKKNLSKTFLCLAGAYGSYKVVSYGYKKYFTEKDYQNVVKKVSVKEKFMDTDLKKLKKIFQIMMPSIWTKQFGLVCLHTSSLIMRAYLSVYVAALDGKITKSIVEKDLFKFMMLLSQWIGVAIPATFVNSLLKYLEGKVSLAFRTVLVKHVYQMYFDKQTYYKVGNLDTRLNAVDESLVEDLKLFCNSVSHLYSHLTKPVLDIALVSIILVKLARKRGETGLIPSIIGVLVVLATGQVLKMISPPFGKLVAEESALRGNLRAIHSRIISNAEEIAFYGGHKVIILFNF